MKEILTIFTPTYNRAYILSQCYEALCKQTLKDFTWLVVDDGSTDNTKQLIEKWIIEKKINIQYVYQENAGKQRAVNTAVRNCKTKFFAFLDSDDYYEKDTVKRFYDIFEKIYDNPKVAGVVARRGTPDKKIVGTPNLPKKEFIANMDVVVKKYKFFGDTCRAYKIDVLRNHLYPEISDKFIPETYMLSSIDFYFDLYFVNEIFSISEYLSDGYTKNAQELYRNNPNGVALAYNQLTIARQGFVNMVKSIIRYTVWCKKNKIIDSYKNCKNKVAYIIFYPLSYIFYVCKIPKWFFE